MGAALFLVRQNLDRHAQGGSQRGRRGSGENIAARTVNQRFNQDFTAGDKRPAHARRLAQRAHEDEARVRRDAQMGAGTRAARAQHAEAVRIIQQQPAIMTARQRAEFGNRCQVAIHAEDGVADDYLARRRARFQHPRQRRHVVVTITAHLGTARLRQQRSVN